ncbi:MAG: hypothetical protein EXR81_01505 [Gammaproteobacteria bacterium]|nr:hypothetical protein [Gammaproteobacteria bacterium]
MQHFDIIIIGAGNAGLTIAAALPANLQIAIIDHKPENTFSTIPKIDGRKIALNYGSKLILDEFNLWPALAPHTTPITQVHISQQGSFGITRLTAEENNTPALGYIVATEILSQALQTQTATQKNITWFYSTTLLNLESTTVNVQHEDINKTLTAKLIIAADGAKSNCRQLLGIECVTTDYQQNALITRVKLKIKNPNIAYERFLRDGTLALLPMQDDYYGVVWMAATEKIAALQKLSDNELLAEIQKKFGYRLGRFIDIDMQRFYYPIHSIIAKTQTKDNCVLLGDSAHLLSPVAAQGFNLTLQDIYCLVGICKSGTRNVPLQQAVEENYEEILEKYLVERLSAQQQVIGNVNRLMTTFSSPHFPLAQLRSAGLTLLDLSIKNKKNISESFMGITPRIQKLLREKHVRSI